jgi:hypothetical protein
MVRCLLYLLLFAANPFWLNKEPKDWSEEELIEFFSNSPWAQPAEAVGSTGGRSSVTAFLATAKPMQAAELELRRRRLNRAVVNGPDPNWDEYREFLERDSGKFIVLAVAIPTEATRDSAEMATVENESVMKVGKKRYKVSGYFPPSPNDPFTRLIFPRPTLENLKELIFEVYVPGTGIPYRQVIFIKRDMFYRGILEM